MNILTVNIQTIIVKLAVIKHDITIPQTSLECCIPLLLNDVSHNGVHPVLALYHPNCDIIFKKMYIKIIMGNLTVCTYLTIYS